MKGPVVSLMSMFSAKMVPTLKEVHSPLAEVVACSGPHYNSSELASVLAALNEAAALELFNSLVMSSADFNKPALLAPPEPTIDYPMQLT